VPLLKTRSVALALAAVLAAAPALANPEPDPPIFEPADSLEGNFLSAYIANLARDTGAAATYFREALKGDARNPDLMERAFIAFLADGAMPEAFKIAEKLAARDGNNGLAQLALGVRAIKQRQYANARTYLMKGARGPAADLTATLLTAWSHAGSGEGKKAQETMDRLKGQRSYAVFRDYHAGLLADLTGSAAEAERYLKSAYEAERNTLRIVDAYGRLESKKPSKDAAIAVFAGFDALLPRHPLVRDALDQLRAGKTLAPLVTSAQEGAAEVLYGLGAAGSGQGGEELAPIVYLRLALHLNPDHPLALITLADIYGRLKRYDRAIEVYNRIPESSPVRPSADIEIGQALEQMERGEEAVRHLEELAKERPDDVEAITALGNVLRARKRYAEAAETYTRAIDRIGTPDASHWTLFYYRGSSFERAKDWPKAEADLKKALELVPDGLPTSKAHVLNYLGYSWVDMGQNIDQAFDMLKRAVELAPRDGMIIDSLGWAYYRLGRYEDAVRELEKAVEQKSGDPVVNDHLGDAYWKVGRRLEARFQWQHAKDSSPEPEDLQKILVKLEKGLEEDEAPAAAENRPASDPAAARRNGG
jgi:tetratricopeptide (TPR) repeat protein